MAGALFNSFRYNEEQYNASAVGVLIALLLGVTLFAEAGRIALEVE